MDDPPPPTGTAAVAGSGHPGDGPRPIDPRGPRFNQAVICILLLVAFVADWPVVIPGVATVLVAGALLGPRFGPFLALYATLIKPRLGPPVELEDPRPPRFAAGFGALVLGASTLAFVAGQVDLGWLLALATAVLAGLASGTGICVGCELYLVMARTRGIVVPRSVGIGRPPTTSPPATAE